MGRHRSAFTLLELLAVIAIIALLMGILVPSLSAARQAAKTNVCLSKLKNIGTSFTIYTTENKDTFPPHRLKRANPGIAVDYANEYNRKHPRWQWFLETGFGPPIDPAPFARLEAPFGDEGLGEATLNGTTMTIDVFVCPALDDEKYSHDERNGAYGYNYQYLGNARQDSNPNEWDNFPVTNQHMKAPGSTVLVADSRGKGPKHGEHSYTLDPPRLAREKRAKSFGPDGGLADLNAFSPVEMRHRNQGNVIFADAHGEGMTLQSLGYQVPTEGVNAGKVIPIDPDATTEKNWTNKLWTGTGQDPKAPATQPAP
jgi:prepilin-type N-terminal cleavage/methylation domain-containing protein/prepilin-type processing-associated H-X9-DG protein